MKGKQPKRLHEQSESTQASKPYLSMEYVRQRGGQPKTFCVAEKGLVLANQDDVLLLWDGANAGEFLKAKSGVVASTSALFTGKVHNGRYLYYVLKQCESHLRAFSVGMGIPHVDGTVLKQMRITIPPPDEQAAIVRYLDWANGRLERVIRAKRQAATLLNEEKQAIVHRAVTRGLDPSVALRPSGIPWLGDVPAHWEVRRLGSLLRERGEANSNGEVSHVLSLLRNRGVIPYSEKGNVGNKKSDDVTRYKIVRPDDIVMNCMNVIIGSVSISQYTGCLSPVYYVLVRRNELDCAHYFNAVFQCSRFHRSLVRIGNGILAHRMRIPMELLKCELLPYPPQTEQVRIIEWLSTATKALDKAIDRTDREIQYLREYRNRLVADVVTGKLDVRDAAAQLPDQAPLESSEPDTALDDEFDIADEEVAV